MSPHTPVPEARRLLGLARPYAGRISAALVLSALAAAGSLATPLGLKLLLDSVAGGAGAERLNLLGAALLTLFVARSAFNFGGTYLLGSIGERVVADLRVRLYRHLHTLDPAFFAAHRTGDLLSRLSNDVAAVRGAATDVVAQAILQLLMLAGSVAVMAALNWRLTLLVAAVVPAITLAARAFAGPLRRLAREVQDLLGTTSAIAEQGLSAVAVVRSFGREAYEGRRYAEGANALFQAARRSIRASAFFASGIDLLFTASVVAIFWYGAAEMLAGRLSVGELVAFLFYALTVSQSVGALAQTWNTFAAAGGASSRIFELLDTRPAIIEASNARALPAGCGEIRFEGVTFGYGDAPAVLRNLSFTVRPGETVAMVGRSGAGKSTLLGLIPRFADPREGTVWVNGADVGGVTLASLRQQISAVQQDVQLFPASVLDNVRYGRLEATKQEVVDALRAANALEFVESLPRGWDTEVGERGIRLSAGQRQRIAIARALLKDAPILLLDEATSALDAESEAAVQEALERLARGRTTLMVAHRLATVRDADRILVLEGGRLVGEGTHEELVLGEGLYARLAAFQFREERTRRTTAADTVAVLPAQDGAGSGCAPNVGIGQVASC
ncbi:MAG TPA: ABC transporter ATP-binding protein [Longimicrobium sp.]|jgi:subfamily B ATP-binding cassette protein MsbA